MFIPYLVDVMVLFEPLTSSYGGSFGLALSIIIRVEIALPGFILCSSLQYNSLITFHGILMIFFMIMPLLIGGFGNLLIPLMLCCYDMIFYVGLIIDCNYVLFCFFMLIFNEWIYVYVFILFILFFFVYASFILFIL